MGRIPARPFEFDLHPARTALVVIDMQRDFLEPGGFGESLGNDVTHLQAIVPATLRLITGFRKAGLPVIHTRECHLPDLSDCPPAKRLRGAPGLRIGDDGPMGRILIAGEPGTEIVPELFPIEGEIVVDKPGKGAFHQTDLAQILRCLAARLRRGHDGSLCSDDHARGERSRLRMSDRGGCDRELFSRLQAGGHRHDDGARGDRRLGRAGGCDP